MPVTIKNTKLTKKQRIAQEILDDLDTKVLGLFRSPYPVRYEDMDKIISNEKVSYGLEAHYPTLREFMRDNSMINFKFKIKGMTIETSGISDFQRIYNSDLLDEYVVKRSRRCRFSSWDSCYTCVKLYLEEKRK